jgi:hypothetical protein
MEANGGSKRAAQPYLREVIVLLTLSISAIAMPPSRPSWLPPKLKKEGVTKLE